MLQAPFKYLIFSNSYSLIVSPGLERRHKQAWLNQILLLDQLNEHTKLVTVAAQALGKSDNDAPSPIYYR